MTKEGKMRKPITFLVAILLIASLVIIGLSCGVDETKKGRFSILSTHYKTEKNDSRVFEGNLDFHCKDRVVTNYTLEDSKPSILNLIGSKVDTIKAAKKFLEYKKEDLGLGDDFDRYIYATHEDRAILLIPELLKEQPSNPQYKRAKVVIMWTVSDGKIFFDELNFFVSYNPPFNINKTEPGDDIAKYPIRIVDINNNHTTDIACFGYEIENGEHPTWNYFQMDNRIQQFVFDIPITKPYLDKEAGKYCILGDLRDEVLGSSYVMPHMLDFSLPTIKDISYKYPQTLKKILQDNNKIFDPTIKILYANQIGLWAKNIRAFSDELSIENFDDESTVSQEISAKELSTFLTDFIYNKELGDKTEHEYEEVVTDLFTEKYFEHMSYANVSDRLEKKFKFKTKKEGWARFSYLYDSKKIVETEDINKINFGSSDATHQTMHTIDPNKPRDNYIYENGSYWPERELGKFVLKEIDDEPDGYWLKDDNFLMTIQKLIYSTCKYTLPTEGSLPSIPIDYSEIGFSVVPLSEKIWCVFTIIEKKSFYGEDFISYCFVKFDNVSDPSGDPIEGLEEIKQLTDWHNQNLESWSRFECIADVNLDGYKDIIINTNGVSATTDMNWLSIYTCIDDTLYAIVIESEALPYKLGYFIGINGGYPQFTEEIVGCAPWDFERDQPACAGYRFSIHHSIEVREDGYLYDVTYRNPINLDAKQIQGAIENEPLVLMEALGHTRAAQQYHIKDLESAEHLYSYDSVFLDGLKDCYEKGVPWQVATKDDIPKGWDIICPWR